MHVAKNCIKEESRNEDFLWRQNTNTAPLPMLIAMIFLYSKPNYVPAQFIPGRTGAGLLLLNGFTFYVKNHQAHGKKQWYCSSRDVHGCRADVITYKGLDGRDYISIFRGRHIHEPPRLRQCHDGRFIREKDVSEHHKLDVQRSQTPRLQQLCADNC
ncbi:hypothetical protein KGM_208269 [Danaus plexippus plexippus]|uniref:FLYWCH-type domain-containing protein n=1 Tax=Danaus plexippus plexippus TaxID=278856 RepID=A0A212EXU1_DANPL|nr:hypothetical protein KGM_208269 [Danaus plexippus plexippus]